MPVARVSQILGRECHRYGVAEWQLPVEGREMPRTPRATAAVAATTPLARLDTQRRNRRHAAAAASHACVNGSTPATPSRNRDAALQARSAFARQPREPTSSRPVLKRYARSVPGVPPPEREIEVAEGERMPGCGSRSGKFAAARQPQVTPVASLLPRATGRNAAVLTSRQRK